MIKAFLKIQQTIFFSQNSHFLGISSFSERFPSSNTAQIKCLILVITQATNHPKKEEIHLLKHKDDNDSHYYGDSQKTDDILQFAGI